jgi:hypothetical protein
MKAIDLELEKLEKRIAPGYYGGGGEDHHEEDHHEEDHHEEDHHEEDHHEEDHHAVCGGGRG